MGGTTFGCKARGKTAREAFQQARAKALYDHGHAGYTGTIAEKHAFTLIKVPSDTDPITYANDLMDDGDPRVDDKWGPAGCLDLGNGEFYFFGWASC